MVRFVPSIMAINTRDLVKVILDLQDIKEMKVAFDVSVECGMITSVATIAGGLLGGPLGIFIGGLCGTAVASYHSHGKFKSVPDILMNHTTPQQQEQLAKKIINLLNANNIFTLAEFMLKLADKELSADIKRFIQDFITKEMKFQII